MSVTFHGNVCPRTSDLRPPQAASSDLSAAPYPRLGRTEGTRPILVVNAPRLGRRNGRLGRTAAVVRSVILAEDHGHGPSRMGIRVPGPSLHAVGPVSCVSCACIDNANTIMYAHC